MSDTRLRALERRWLETGTEDDEAALLAERVRAGELAPEVTTLAAYFGSKVAGLVHGEVNTPPDHLTSQNIRAALHLAFGNKTETPPRTREFLEHIFEHDLEMRAILNHYELVQEGDVSPPNTKTAIKALMDHLMRNPNHREAIAQMNRPVLQLIPVFEPEGAGFQRIVDAINNHRRQGQTNTFLTDELRMRWEMAEGTAKIVKWKVAVVEGAKDLPEEWNPHRNETLEEQLRLSVEDSAKRGLQLFDNLTFAMLQMREIMAAPEGTPLRQLGIDHLLTFTILKDVTRQPGSLVPYGCWYGYRVYFDELNPDEQNVNARVRFAIVVNLS